MNNPAAGPIAPGGDARTADPRPDAPPTDEVVAAIFPQATGATKSIDELTASGLPRERIITIRDKPAQRRFMEQYVHQEPAVHQHTGVGAVMFGCAGAAILAFIVLVFLDRESMGNLAFWIVAIVAGSAGAAIGGFLGAYALRPADNKTAEVVEQALNREGVLLAVSRPEGTSLPLEDILKSFIRHGGTALRLKHRPTLADLHPGDARVSAGE